jgi:hypothetical protein
MDEQFKDEVAKRFTRAWSERRGIESIDRNAQVVLVKVPLNELSDALAAKAIASQRNVIAAEIEVSSAFVFAYQLVGHSWSIMIPGVGYPSILQSSELSQLSKQLRQPIINLLVSDGGGENGYDLFEGGELVDYFRGSDGESTDDANEYEIQPQRYVLSPYPDEDFLDDDLEEDEEPEPQQTAYFWSLHRQLTAEEIGNIWNFTEQFLVEYDAFDPAIDSSYLLGEYSLKRGNRYRIQNPGFTLVVGYETDGRRQEITSVPDLARVDYFKFKS